MPCYDPRDHNSIDYDVETSLRQALDERTSQLCFVLNMLALKHPAILLEMPIDIIQWYKQHAEFDKKRKEAEK